MKGKTTSLSTQAKDLWVQDMLFPARLVRTRADSRPARRRLSYSRVTRDEDVALSYAESRVVAAEARGGLVAAFGRLSPERQAALRALVTRGPSLEKSA